MRQRQLKTVAAAIIAFATMAGMAGASVIKTQTYSDPTGEEFSGNANLDISSVTVANDATDLTISITLNSNIQTGVGPDWGKYMVGIDSASGGDSAGNPWTRPISMSSGMDYWLGSWVDGGGGEQVWKFNAGWSQIDTRAPFISGNTLTLSASLASLGLADGSTFAFDVYSGGGGGGDSANDASSNPAQSTGGWSGPYDSGSTVSVYTVVVPEPASASLVAIALSGIAARRRRW